MRKMIERQRVLETIANVDNYGDGVAYEALGHAYRDVALIPTVDAIPVIRCEDCKYCRTYYHGENMPFSYACDKLYLTNNLSSDDYCSRAERKEE